MSTTKTTVSPVLDSNGRPWQKLLRLAWPITLSMLLQNSYNLADMFWVSWLGKEAVAGVTLTGIIFWMTFAISQIFGTGVHALVARACGFRRPEKAAIVLRDGLLTGILTGILLAVIVNSMPGRLLELLGASPAVSQAGIPYLCAIAVGFPITLGLFILSSAFRAAGDMITPLYLTAVSCIINILLDPVLIFGLGPVPELGLAGAAVATVLSLGVAFGLGLLALRRSKVFPRFHVLASVDPHMLRDMIAVGLPAGLHYVLLSLTQTVMVRMVAEFGDAVLAAAGIAARLTQFMFLPCMGLGAATATLVGQYLGAQRQQEARTMVRFALRIDFVFTLGLSLILFAQPALLLSIFSRDAEVINPGTIYLRIFAVSFLFTTMTIILTRVFQGAGDTVWPTLAAMLRFGIFCGLSWLLAWPLGFGAVGVWLGMAASSVVQFVLVAWLYSLGTWERRKLRSLEKKPADVAAAASMPAESEENTGC